MPTPYNIKNQVFSDAAHIAAQSQIYPILFNVNQNQLRFTTTSLACGEKERILDGEMAIDRIVSVSVPWFKSEIEFTVQERFRQPKYMKYKDITITEWNHATNLKSELYKLNAGIFVYGYFDIERQKILDWIVVNTIGLLGRLVKKRPSLKKERNPRSNQSFLTFNFDHLAKAGIVLGRKR